MKLTKWRHAFYIPRKLERYYRNVQCSRSKQESSSNTASYARTRKFEYAFRYHNKVRICIDHLFEKVNTEPILKKQNSSNISPLYLQDSNLKSCSRKGCAEPAGPALSWRIIISVKPLWSWYCVWDVTVCTMNLQDVGAGRETSRTSLGRILSLGK